MKDTKAICKYICAVYMTTVDFVVSCMNLPVAVAVARPVVATPVAVSVVAAPVAVSVAGVVAVVDSVAVAVVDCGAAVGLWPRLLSSLFWEETKYLFIKMPWNNNSLSETCLRDLKT